MKSFKTYLTEKRSQVNMLARSLGLQYLGFGRWGKDHVTTYRQMGDRLVKLEPHEQEEIHPEQRSIRANNTIEIHKDIKKGELTSHEKKSIEEYTRDSYFVNKALYNGQKGIDKLYSQYLQDMKNGYIDHNDPTTPVNIIHNLDSAMVKHPLERDVILYRGVSSKTLELFQTHVGGIVNIPAYFSTSTKPLIGMDFATKHGAMLVIHAKANTSNAIPAKALSRHRKEDEILLDRNLNFKVIRIEDRPSSIKRIVVEIV
jgi:hypothetical protein